MHKKNYQKSEDGFASIVVTLIVMSIVVLISVGFVRVVNREQRASIDRQLSTQAFYAAETGVNDAAELLKDEGFLQDLIDDDGKDECDVSDTSLWSPVLDDSIEYTCVLIEPEPEDLVYDSITEDVRVIYIRGDGPVGELLIDWQAEPEPEFPSFPATGTDFPASWPSGAGVMRVALTPLSNVDRDSLINNTYTVFLRPEDGASPTSTPPSAAFFAGSGAIDNQGQILRVPCNEDREPMFCRARITNLNNADGYLLAVRSIYLNSSLRISSPGFEFQGEQAVVDSTGRASDVLRRIQTRLRLRDDFPFPSFAVQAGICKSYSLYPGSGTTPDSDCSY